MVIPSRFIDGDFRKKNAPSFEGAFDGLHIKAIIEEGELPVQATCKELLQVRSEGGRNVQRKLQFYNLNMILAIGYRVRSLHGTHFRQ